ncbi:hypothetical protein EON76_04530 [bacterium]|nr:MAG: hypothetical protein EON76_04530 [bacterium]
MKHRDLESQLHDMPTEPRRPLHRDFTKQTIERIDMNTRKSYDSRPFTLRRLFTMKLSTLTRPVVMAGVILGLTAAGGTAYAIVKGWPQAASSFASESTLANGNVLYTVESTDCVTTRTQDVKQKSDWTNIKPSSRLTKFEVMAGTKVDTKDLEQAALAACNEGASRKQLQTVLESVAPNLTPAAHKAHYNDVRLKVSAIDGTNVTGQVQKWVYDESIKNTKIVNYTRTYDLDTQVKTYDYDAAISLSEIKVGDTVELLLYSDDMPNYQEGISGGGVEGQDPAKLSGPQQGVSVVGVIKTPAFVSRLQATQLLIDKHGDKVRVESITVE